MWILKGNENCVTAKKCILNIKIGFIVQWTKINMKHCRYHIIRDEYFNGRLAEIVND